MTKRSTTIHFATSATTVACHTRGRMTCTTDRAAVLLGKGASCLHCRNVLAEQDCLRCVALYRELGMAA